MNSIHLEVHLALVHHKQGELPSNLGNSGLGNGEWCDEVEQSTSEQYSNEGGKARSSYPWAGVVQMSHPILRIKWDA